MHRSIAASLAILLTACPQQPGTSGGTNQPGVAPGNDLALARAPAAGSTLREGGSLAGLTPAFPQYPDYHGGVIVFSAEGDLWEVAAGGGLARRMTSDRGQELFPKFSPDGAFLAFSGEYDGNQDVYVMPASGGTPRRLTFHPARDQVIGWTPDGREVLFRSDRAHPHGAWTLHRVPLAGGDPVQLPLDRAARLSYEPGGKHVAFTRLTNEMRDWKRYAGGRAEQIMIGDLATGPFATVTTFKGANAFPMWHAGRVYFLSDRTGTMNLWSMTPEGGDLTQHTTFTDFDARFPSLGDGLIVYQQRTALRLFDPTSGQDREVPITLLSDATEARERFTQPLKYLRGFDLSPDGSYLGLEVRGDLHLVPAAKEGRKMRLATGSASRERGVSFSPDGSQIATISDKSGEDEVWVYQATAAGSGRQLTTQGKPFKYQPVWSPDGSWIVYGDSDNRLWAVRPAPSMAGPNRQLLDESPYGPIGRYAFSPDGQWLAYTKLEDNYFTAIYLRKLDQPRSVRLSSGFQNDDSPVWSSDGSYLVFISDRAINPYLDWAETESVVHTTSKLYLVLLKAGGRSPFLPKDPAAKADAKDGTKGGPGEHGGKPKLPSVQVDSAGIGERVVEIPVAPGNYFGLYAGAGFVLYLSQPTLGMADWGDFMEGRDRPSTLMRFDFDSKKAETFMADLRGYAVSADGSKVAVLTKDRDLYAFKLAQKAPSGDDLKEAKVAIATIRELVDPRQEWRQIYFEAWRLMRDFYWERGMGGVDWAAMRDKYAALLPAIATRQDLNDLLGELMAELSVGHTYLWGGETPQTQPVPAGLLGADLVPDGSGFYRISRIYRGENWDARHQSPLTLSHVDVKEGEYLLAIDGLPAKPGTDVYALLQKAAGELVQLTVNARPSLIGGRAVEVETLASEDSVRYTDWVEKNRLFVDQKTAGRVGYLHLPDMMTAGMVSFDRWYYPQARKAGLIIDARYNRGGFVSQIIVKRLSREVLSWAKSRSGYLGPYPDNSPLGPIVVLTNECAGSDGDIFPRAVQVAKIGPVIGTRTWGGVIGINLNLLLVDNGMSTQPTYLAWWEHERKYGVEGEGVNPDILLDNDPGEAFRGRDAQLERAIAEVLGRLEKAAKQPPDFGPPPDKSKKAWVEKYGQTDKP